MQSIDRDQNTELFLSNFDFLPSYRLADFAARDRKKNGRGDDEIWFQVGILWRREVSIPYWKFRKNSGLKLWTMFQQSCLHVIFMEWGLNENIFLDSGNFVDKWQLRLSDTSFRKYLYSLHENTIWHNPYFCKFDTVTDVRQVIRRRRESSHNFVDFYSIILFNSGKNSIFLYY